MIQRLFQTDSLPLLERVVNFSQTRHNLLAGNIANIDTPGYRAKDLDTEQFTAQLRSLAESRRSGIPSPGDGIDDITRVGAESSPLEWGNLVRHDDGDVNLEQQVAQLSKNYMQHNLAMTIMNQQFRLLQAAVSERV